MSRLFAPPVLVATLLLLLGAAGTLGWLWLRAGRPDHLPTRDIVVLLLPVAALWGAALFWGVDRQKLAIAVWSVWMFAAMVPLLYVLGTRHAPAAPASAPAPAASGDTRDIGQPDRLFAGAVADNEMALAVPGLRYLRVAAFADGTGLQFFHFDSGAAAADYYAILARSYGTPEESPALETGGGLTARQAGQLAHLRRHGSDILAMRAPDAAALQARLAGWRLPPAPGPQAPAAAARFRLPPQALFGLGYGLGLAGAAVGFLLWLGYWAARVPPPAGYAAVTAEALRQRLYSLNDSALGIVATPGEQPGEVQVRWVWRDGKRATAMRLRLQPERKRVLARESSTVAGDKPLNASEARMRFSSTGSQTHPDADILYRADRSVTIPQEEVRRSLGIRVVGTAVQFPADAASRIPPTALPHLLTEIVHQSGWTWQGAFFFQPAGGDSEAQRAP